MYLKPPRTTPQPSQNRWNPGRTLRSTTPDHPAALAEPGGTLVERWWNAGGTLPQKPSWNLPSNHPGPPRSPCRTWWNPGGTLVEPYLKPPRTTPQPSQNLVEPWWNLGGTLVEPSWNLTPGPPRTTPEPIWAETPKLSAVGEKRRKKNTHRHTHRFWGWQVFRWRNTHFNWSQNLKQKKQKPFGWLDSKPESPFGCPVGR